MTALKIGAQLANGWTVVSQSDDVVLAMHPENQCTPFATWVIGADGSTYWGHYHTDIANAVADFEERGRVAA